MCKKYALIGRNTVRSPCLKKILIKNPGKGTGMYHSCSYKLCLRIKPSGLYSMPYPAIIRSVI